MEAAHIAWRPLGQLFVERGLITQDELEEALLEQQETRKRLGAILISRGLVSGPEVTSVLVDQLGTELTRESGFGSGSWNDIRRHQRGRTPTDDEANENGGHELAEAADGEEDPEEVEATAADARERASLAVAQDDARAERMTLEKTLADERAAKQQALDELAQARAEASARSAELRDLTTQVVDLRTQIHASADVVATGAARAGVSNGTPELVSRVAELEEQLTAEGTKTAVAVTAGKEADARAAELETRLASVEAELDHARGEARNEAIELRAAIARLRGEIDDLDAATAWFEYWSGAAAPAATPTSQYGA